MIIIRGKEVDITSFEWDGLDFNDYPDFCDAYVTEAKFVDGTDLSDDDYGVMYDDHGQELYEALIDYLH